MMYLDYRLSKILSENRIEQATIRDRRHSERSDLLNQELSPSVGRRKLRRLVRGRAARLPVEQNLQEG